MIRKWFYSGHLQSQNWPPTITQTDNTYLLCKGKYHCTFEPSVLPVWNQLTCLCSNSSIVTYWVKSKPVKQEVTCTVILPLEPCSHLLPFPATVAEGKVAMQIIVKNSNYLQRNCLLQVAADLQCSVNQPLQRKWCFTYSNCFHLISANFRLVLQRPHGVQRRQRSDRCGPAITVRNDQVCTLVKIVVQWTIG